jgi:hypothetical protein
MNTDLSAEKERKSRKVSYGGGGFRNTMRESFPTPGILIAAVNSADVWRLLETL